MGVEAYLLPLIGIGYLGWLGTLVIVPSQRRYAYAMAAGATVVWAAAAYWDRFQEPLADSAVATVGVLRLWAWVFLVDRLISYWDIGPEPAPAGGSGRRSSRAALLLASLIAAASIAMTIRADLYGPLYEPLDNATLGRLCLAVIGLVLLETLLTLAPSLARWAIKHMLIGFGAAFAFDLFLYSEAMLLKQIGEVTAAVQPFVIAFALPLIWISERRLRGIRSDIAVSRTVMLRTTALIASGLYLLGVAGIGFLIQRFGWTWGPALQMAGFIGALLVLAVMLASSQVRAQTRWWLSRNFFRLHYDYRNEWLRFVETMAGEDALAGRLHWRAIKATADLMDCSSGALYLRTRHSGFRLAAEMALGSAQEAGTLPPSLWARLQPEAPIVDLTALDSPPEGPEARWLDQIDGGWVLLGLQHRRRLVGALVLAFPRVRRPLSWEDRDLLQIFSAQIGSYIAEEQVTLALAEAQRFERMSKNFSFIAHDIKNLVTQLSLVVSQAKRHGDNPEFQKDVLSTVADSVEKMRTMLLRLRDVQPGDGDPENGPVALGPLVADLFQRKGALIGRLTVGSLDDTLHVRADPTTLAAVLENLVQNALDAVGQDGQVTVHLVRRESPDGVAEAVLAIEDNGIGMTQAFIDDHLFQPFVSTKETGFGLGMYQCREWVERWQGRLELQSVPGQGTTARVVLPVAGEPAAANRNETH